MSEAINELRVMAVEIGQSDENSAKAISSEILRLADAISADLEAASKENALLERKMVTHVRLSAEATEGIRAALKASTIQLAHMATGFPVNPDDLKTQVETNYKVMK